MQEKQREIENTEEIGKMSFSLFLFKILATSTGGVLGTLVLILLYVITASLFTPFSDSGELQVSLVIIFILILIVFISSTIANVLSALFLTFTEKNKYKRVSTAIYQISVISVIIFLFMLPVYILVANINPTILAYAVSLHLVLSVFVTALTLELVSNYKYSLVSLYSITLGTILASAVMFSIAGLMKNIAILLFLALPIYWGLIGFATALVQGVYSSLVNIYDKDFLSTQTIYGNDYGKAIEPQTEKKLNSETGAEFLSKISKKD